MGLLEKIFGKKNDKLTTNKLELLNLADGDFFEKGNTLFKSDIIRACIRPKARAIGKLKVKHIRGTLTEPKVNSDPWIRNLFDEPNPFMTGQVLLEKLATQLDLNNNAFAFIKRNEFGFPTEIFPIEASRVEVEENKNGEVFLKFFFKTDKDMTVPYRDVIHLRQDFSKDDFFGKSPFPALEPLLDIISRSDLSLVEKIKNSKIANWILTFKEILDQDEIEKNVNDFVNNYMKFTGDKVKAAEANPLYSLSQVNADGFIPDSQKINEVIRRIYSFFNTNERIVQGSFTEFEWNSYFQSVINPIAEQLSGEVTRKLFSKNDQGFGNRIIFEDFSLPLAPIPTKLALKEMVDRGSLTPNEWRLIMGMGFVEDGEKPIRNANLILVKNPDKDRAEREQEKRQMEQQNWEREKQCWDREKQCWEREKQCFEIERQIWEWEKEKDKECSERELECLEIEKRKLELEKACLELERAIIELERGQIEIEKSEIEIEKGHLELEKIVKEREKEKREKEKENATVKEEKKTDKQEDGSKNTTQKSKD